MSTRVIESLMAEFKSRGLVLLLDDSIMGALYTFDPSFVERPHPADTVVEIATNQPQYHPFDLSHFTSEVDPLTGDAAIWIPVSLFTPYRTFMLVRPYLQSQIHLPSPCK